MDALRAVEEAVEFIEKNLDAAPRIDEIARASGLSRAHFQRVFRAIVGESVGVYARRRRLSRSVDALLSTRRRILDVALEAGFDSQEAYTRAFREQFGIPPGRFRARGQRAPGLALPRLTRARIEASRRLSDDRPRIVEREAAGFAGITTRFVSVLSDDTDSERSIPALWTRFLASWARRGITNVDAYGLCTPVDEDERSRCDEFEYTAAVRECDLPCAFDDLERRAIPAATYAVFDHDAPATELPATIFHILTQWLPNSDFTYAPGIELERHPFRREAAIEYWLPIEPLRA